MTGLEKGRTPGSIRFLRYHCAASPLEGWGNCRYAAKEKSGASSRSSLAKVPQFGAPRPV